ncbi:hypothetical protein CERZMDRAFT_88950 [Cercospora zeae-maydis SCOH1-5]|uniref:Uncharacterized protein n=1 Tax=Cercospora zeae-maydis SCOH1-5 TaxID=717836 RepID=A0A6A6F0U0_9PEZI|nr:hypothetical protein CERZMDRAFT_88950 [Cercospora zeae-maydis SCOH1-5]
MVVKELGSLHERGWFSTAPEQVAGFIRAFQALQPNFRGTATVDPRKMREIMDAHGLLNKDCCLIVQKLMLTGDKIDRITGKMMLLSMSRAGVDEATIRIMAHAVRQARKRPQVLDSGEIEHAKQHLSQIASEKKDFRAMVCEGKVARALGNEERAIEMWTDAMSAAVEAAEEKERNRTDGVVNADGMDSDPLELSSPWIELMLLHRDRYEKKGKKELKQCLWAMEVGCKQDDPLSFYHASTFVKTYGAKGLHTPTAEWLYMVTKAAASNHPLAAYELGEFYAQSGWVPGEGKYLEDEPPNHVKPTPFDSFPPPTNNSIMHAVKLFFGLAERTEIKPEESLFHTAIFPHTARERYQLALEWLNIAVGYCYAPAFLLRARLNLEKTLWAYADAPQAAINMSADRYDYASEEDYNAGKRIERPEEKEREDPPNPFYSVNAAISWLRQVFYAYESQHYSLAFKEARVAARRRKRTLTDVDDDDDIDEEDIEKDSVLRKQSFAITKWFRHPEVRDMYEHKLEGLYLQAKKICDDHGLDIYDDEGGLIYKAGSGQSRPVNV